MRALAERPALSVYRAKLAGKASLTPEAEIDLAQRYRQGDRKAGDQLIEACLPFVLTIAFEYRRWGLPMEDVIQEGNIGLLKAAERFDPSRACRLATYAAYWIRAEIREFVARGYRIVRLGSSKSERRALRAYRTTSQDPAELARVSGMSPDRVEALLPLLASRDVSLDREIGDGGMTHGDLLASDRESPEDAACAADERDHRHQILVRALAELSPRERRIMDLRWLSETPATLEEIGADFGVSKERVRQLEERAKNRMRVRIEELRGETSTSP